MALGYPRPAGKTASLAAFLIKGMGVCVLSRGILKLNFVAVPRSLRGVPVGTAAKALRANGLRPFFRASAPVAVKMPHLTRSRRVI